MPKKGEVSYRKGTKIPKRDIRVRRRNEAARMVEKPEDLDLNRIPSGGTRDEQMKAAVLASILLGQPVTAIAAQYNLPYQTVYNWKEAFDITNPVNRRDRLSENLLVFIEQEIKNMVAISIATSDTDWIRDQSASELASYISVKHASLMRVLEAFGKASAHADDLRQKQEIVQIEGETE